MRGIQMREIFFLLILTLAFASPAWTAGRGGVTQRVSIAELEQLLAAAHGQPDGKVARQLSGLELTERASSARLAQWETAFPGRHCHDAFIGLADASAFFSLPAADLPANPPPNADAQKAIVVSALKFVETTTTRLPNFYATRRTEHFEDTPSHQTLERVDVGSSSRRGAMPGMVPAQTAYVPLSLIDTTSVNVSYRDGAELRASKKVDFSSLGPAVHGLETSGEFGPILAVALGGAIHGQIFWSHWEQARASLPAGSLAAVFRYTVPKEQSNYMVAIPHGQTVEQVRPAYHGEFTIDPSTGAILRITVVSDLAPPDQLIQSSIVVEYGPVLIGGANYICPVRSMAFSKTPYLVGSDASTGASTAIQTQLNDTAFIDYHLFRSESRVLTEVNSATPQSTAQPAKSNP